VDNEQLIRSYVDAWNAKDLTKLHQVFSGECRWSPYNQKFDGEMSGNSAANMNGGVNQGNNDAMTHNSTTIPGMAGEVIPELWQQMHDRYSDLKMEIDSITPDKNDKNKSTLNWTLRGKEKMGDSHPWELSGNDTFEFKDGKISSVRSSLDQGVGMKQQNNQDRSGQGSSGQSEDQNMDQSKRSGARESEVTSSNQGQSGQGASGQSGDQNIDQSKRTGTKESEETLSERSR